MIDCGEAGIRTVSPHVSNLVMARDFWFYRLNPKRFHRRIHSRPFTAVLAIVPASRSPGRRRTATGTQPSGGRLSCQNSGGTRARHVNV